MQGRQHAFFLRFSTFLLIVAGAMLTWILYDYTHQKKPPYGMVLQQDGKKYIRRMPPLSRPLLNQDILLYFAQEAATATYTFDALNYRNHFQKMAYQYFTPDASDNFITAMQNSDLLKSVYDKQLLVTAVAQGTPVILGRRVINGVLTWKIQLPLIVHFESASEDRSTRRVVSMLIVSEETDEMARGYGIQQFSG